MKISSGTVVLITGGASGIGKLMGEWVLRKGAELILLDINQALLEQTVSAFASLGKVTGYPIDLSDDNQIDEVMIKIGHCHPPVDLLINNAGIIVGKYFHQHSVAEMRRTMDINSIAPMVLTGKILPGMMERGKGHICNIASSAGLLGNPRMSVYAASKWAAIGWSDSLRIEMNQLKTGIVLTTVAPYYINTGMFSGVKSRILPILKPEKVVRRIMRGIEQDKSMIRMPFLVNFVRLFQGLLPQTVFDWVVGQGFGIYTTMDHFEGRKN
ncbi:MAG: SDR family oxidoreductase [Marinilabiliales bacterium]|nr:SDR family oxidoreductase [Marinilabiliales bacterium]